MNKAILALLVAAVAVLGILAYTGMLLPGQIPQGNITNPDIKTFSLLDGPVETIDGKPVIRLYSTTWCPHCVWIKPTFDRVAKEHADAGKIVAYHWELDTGDNTLTEQAETAVPESEMAAYRKFNPGGSIPTYAFGGKYWRIGNGYEREQDLGLEEKEFRAVIEELIKEAE